MNGDASNVEASGFTSLQTILIVPLLILVPSPCMKLVYKMSVIGYDYQKFKLEFRNIL